MNLPNRDNVLKNIEMKIHNAIFECVVCNEHHDLLTEKMRVVIRVKGVAPVNSGTPQRPGADQQLAPLIEYAPVCVGCFEELELTEDEPKIVVPNFIPPKDVAEALKKN